VIRIEMRLFSIIAVGALAIGGVLVAPRPAPSIAPATSPDTVDFLMKQRSRGSAAAPVTVFEMSDLQCPFCKSHAQETRPGLERE
jgi:protein-disulfide isomerase